MKKIICSAAFIAALPLAGCSYFDSSSNIHIRDREYLAARSIPPLKIPPGISSSKIHNEYPVSNRQYSDNALKISIDPPGL